MCPRVALEFAALAWLLGIGTGCGGQPATPAAGSGARTSAASPAPSASRADDTSSPAAVARAWVAAITTGDWERCASLYPPDVQARVRAEIHATTPDQRARLQQTARRIEDALARGEPRFVDVPAVLAEPAHQEWYYCGEPPPGEVWRSPCSVAVIEVSGHWYIADVD